MSATRAPIQTLDEAVERIEALEDLIENGFEYLSPSVYSINEKGEIEAKISGKIEAKGIVFQEGAKAGEALSQIEWAHEGGHPEVIRGYRNEAGNGHNLAFFSQLSAATFSGMVISSNPTANTSRVEIQSVRESEPSRLILANLENEASAELQAFHGGAVASINCEAFAGGEAINLVAGGIEIVLINNAGNSAFVQTAGAGLERVGTALGIANKGIKNEMLDGVCIQFGGVGNNVSVAGGTIIEEWLAKECVKGGVGGNIFIESITGGEGGQIAAFTITGYNVRENSLPGTVIEANTLKGSVAAPGPSPAAFAKEGVATATAGNPTGLSQYQRFGLIGNGVQTTWKCKHKLGTTLSGTKFVTVGGTWKCTGEEPAEPAETRTAPGKVVIISTTEVEVIFAVAPAKAEKIIVDLLSA